MVTRLAALRSTKTLSDVALLLGVTPKGLAYTIRVQPLASRYTTFTVPKKSGGVRTIRAPEPGLKLIQSRLASLLQDCILDINAERGVEEKISHGFRRGRSIVTNAGQHCSKRLVLNLDLLDFFPSINLGRVRGFFISNVHFGLKEPVANTLAQIVCHENELPQGAPTSPVMSNLIAHILDVRLARLAKGTGCRYTRYADDLTFSTNLKEIPAKLARYDEPNAKWIVGSRLRKEIKGAGFLVNDTKTRLQLEQSRQDVTGIIVNKGVNVRVEYYKDARAKCDRLFKTGKYHETVRKVLDDGTVEFAQKDGDLGKLDGKMSFIDFVKHVRRRQILARLHETKEKPERGFLALYRKYLYFRNFYAISQPLIICEGKTDNTYIKYAALDLHEKFPLLVENKEQTLALRVRLFKYTDVTQRILALGGGTSQLCEFLGSYKRSLAGFLAPGKTHPVIIVIDNDSGAKGIYGTIKKLTKNVVDGTAQFYHITENLYIVPTPKMKTGGDTMIESFLPKKWLSHKLNGKVFNPANVGLDTSKEFGKFIMSEHVIKKNHKSVDFRGFGPLLVAISAAIEDHYNKAH